MVKKSFIEKIKCAVDDLATENSNASEEPDVIFFRGQNSKHKLQPSLLRNCDTAKISRVENRLFCDTFVVNPESNSCNSSWETLAMMQHFGVPTRLLDWTSSLGIALFFAVEKCLE